MAMNKKEQAMVEELREELAFRWPTEAEPERMDIPVQGTIVGFDFNVHKQDVYKCQTGSRVHHKFDSVTGDRHGIGSQGGKALYRTQKDALLGLRWAMCRKAAADLRRIDEKIEQLNGED